MKHLLIILLVYISLIYTGNPCYPQEDIDEQRISELIYLEAHAIPKDSLIDIYISYKITYKNLVFVKEGDEYKAGLSLYVDVFNDNNVVTRGSTKKEIAVDNYEATNSLSDYLAGIICFTVPKRIYKIIPTLNINNTQRTIVLKEYNLLPDREFNDWLVKPIVVESLSEECTSNSNYQLANTKNYIPYSPKSFELLLPVLADSIKTIHVKVKQNGNEAEYNLKAESVVSSIAFEECGNNIAVTYDNEGKSISIFRLSNINMKLNEGIAEAIVTAENYEPKTFSYNVVWIDKPKSLEDVEYAIKMLKDAATEEEIDKILDNKSDDYYQKLIEFWSKRDPQKSTSFNELMAEYYNRVDYANMNFSTKDKRGASMDRGYIFIKLGHPSNIERIFYEKGFIVEIWHYDRIKKDFYFSDTTGLGNFTLIK